MAIEAPATERVGQQICPTYTTAPHLDSTGNTEMLRPWRQRRRNLECPDVHRECRFHLSRSDGLRLLPSTEQWLLKADHRPYAERRRPPPAVHFIIGNPLVLALSEVEGSIGYSSVAVPAFPLVSSLSIIDNHRNVLSCEARTAKQEVTVPILSRCASGLSASRSPQAVANGQRPTARLLAFMVRDIKGCPI